MQFRSLHQNLAALALGLSFAGLACHRVTPAAASAATHATASRAHVSAVPPKGPEPKPPATPPSPEGSPEVPRVSCPTQTERLDAASKAYDAHKYDVALSCAEDELLDDPESAPAEQSRASALAALGRVDEARLVYTHALALDPDDPEILADAADLYLSRGNVTREYDEIALEYARRGERRSRRRRPELLEQLELLQGMALNDLGRSQEAAHALGEALDRDPKDLDARYEHAVALFELCRFAEAAQDLREVLVALPDDAYAHHELGLALERLGDAKASRAELARATELDGEAFPAPVAVSMPEFKGMVDGAVQALPADLKKDLSQVKLSVDEMPDLADLTVDDPPLSPTILGLFRGEPLGQDSADGPHEQRAILLYRRNLARVARTKDELAKQVQVTLYHELGHLRGADDDELRLRGLE